MDIESYDYYFSAETEHFYFDVYKAWDGSGGGAMFRAGVYIKKNNRRKYYIDCGLFAEWDYKDKQTAFEAAKEWIYKYLESLKSELDMDYITPYCPNCGAKMDLEG